MITDPEKHSRRSIRLKGYDYARAGAYFVTVCARNRECLFGQIADGRMRVNEFGRIVRSAWEDLPHHYANVVLDSFVIMPNHVHGIVILTSDAIAVGAGLKPALGNDPSPESQMHENKRAGLKPAPTIRRGLPEIVRAFKTFSSRRINRQRGTPGARVWQRNYYERVVRGEDELRRIREYVETNPIRWDLDPENPSAENSGKDDPW